MNTLNQFQNQTNNPFIGLQQMFEQMQQTIEQQAQIINQLTQHLEQQNQTSKSTVYNVDDSLTATTTEVSMRTGYVYNWVLLKRWCVEHNYEIPKANYFGLDLNDYPAQAWLDVYNIDLHKLFK